MELCEIYFQVTVPGAEGVWLPGQTHFPRARQRENRTDQALTGSLAGSPTCPAFCGQKQPGRSPWNGTSRG